VSNRTYGGLSEDAGRDIKARALRGIAKTAAPSLAISILLFVSAGRLDWTMAWLGPVAIALVAGFDLRYGWQPEVSPLVQGAGVVIVILGYAMALWAMATNRFFSGVVRIQEERGHTVVGHGPYALVRHPGYVGVSLAALGAPLMLGSAWALIPAAATIVVIVVRTAYEDRTLVRDLAGYEAYARRVRYRLLPGVW